VGDTLVEVEHAALDVQRDHQVRGSLGRGEHAGQRVAGAAGTGPQVDDPFTSERRNEPGGVVTFLNAGAWCDPRVAEGSRQCPAGAWRSRSGRPA